MLMFLVLVMAITNPSPAALRGVTLSMAASHEGAFAVWPGFGRPIQLSTAKSAKPMVMMIAKTNETVELLPDVEDEELFAEKTAPRARNTSETIVNVVV